MSRAKIRRRIHFAVGTVVVLATAAAMWWAFSARHAGFEALAEEGRAELQTAVVTEPSAGRDHHSGTHSYDHRFPTSGPHSPDWVEPGVYTRRPSDARLVHALEHGNIVIYYDDPGEDAMGRLREWAALHDGQWSGIVVVPASGLGSSIVLTAWTKRLQLDELRTELAAAFIDAYRGRGPENPVR
ncbi:MAG: DUF3105 domain-containing protein [Halofilum sp. (in: g-proteobacteria)]|nr:DUF3105 domain-containing protein [Halofilum sp. (in: g-proteobacteria)]